MKKIIFILFFILVFFLIYLFQFNCSRLSCLTFEDSKKYQLKEIYVEEKNIFRGLYENNKELLRLEILAGLGSEEAGKTISTRIVRIKSMFEDAPSPYPGEISDIIKCDEKYKPKLHSVANRNLKVNYFIGSLNDRYQFGVCNEDQIENKGYLVIFYCADQQKLYQLELISSKQEFEKNSKKYERILKTLHCRLPIF